MRQKMHRILFPVAVLLVMARELQAFGSRRCDELTQPDFEQFPSCKGLEPVNTVDLYGINCVDDMTINISWRLMEGLVDPVNLINLEYICYVNSTEAKVNVFAPHSTRYSISNETVTENFTDYDYCIFQGCTLSKNYIYPVNCWTFITDAYNISCWNANEPTPEPSSSLPASTQSTLPSSIPSVTSSSLLPSTTNTATPSPKQSNSNGASNTNNVIIGSVVVIPIVFGVVSVIALLISCLAYRKKANYHLDAMYSHNTGNLYEKDPHMLVGYSHDRAGSVLTIVHALEYDQAYSQLTDSNINAEGGMGWKMDSPSNFTEDNQRQNNNKALSKGNNNEFLTQSPCYSNQSIHQYPSLYFRPLVRPNYYISSISMPNLQTLAVQNDSLSGDTRLSHPNIREASCDKPSSDSSSYTTSMSSLVKGTLPQSPPKATYLAYDYPRYKSASDYIPTSEYAATSSGYISTSDYIRTASDYSSDYSPTSRHPRSCKPLGRSMSVGSFNDDYISFTNKTTSLDNGINHPVSI